MKSFVRQLSEAFTGKSQPELNKGNSLEPDIYSMHKSKSTEIPSLRASRSAEILQKKRGRDPRREALFCPAFSKPIDRIQDVDRSFFESFTALCWRQENRRLQQLRDENSTEIVSSDGILPWGNAPKATMLGFKPECEQLYLEVLYTLRHRIGPKNNQNPGCILPGDLIKYSQTAFGADLDTHLKFCAMASEEKAPILVLNVIVYEAEGLEAKDPNGFSDPYCMLGIQLGNALSSPPKELDDYSPNDPGESKPPSGRRDSLIANQMDKFKKSGGFRLSFKRRDGPPATPQTRREQSQHRDSVLPAKFIRATSVRPHTLNPKWNEKFRFDIDDPHTDSLHLDIWDHDDEYSVLEAVSKLNEIKGVKGLGRFFKQIAQSARGSGAQDDFLGCINIPLSEVPSTGLELWAKLEGRSHRSNIQGRIRLKLWLSTREDFGMPEEDTLIEIKQQEQLYAIFIDYELAKFQGPAWQWSGDLPPEAQAVLHQHAIQGDVTAIQSALVKWLAYSKKLTERCLHFAILEALLIGLEENRSSADPLSKDEEELLGQSFTEFLNYCLKLLKSLRYYFVLSQPGCISNLESMLRCLVYMTGMYYYRKVCPFNKELRGELMTAIRRGTIDWYGTQCERFLSEDIMDKDLHDAPVPMARLVSNLVSDLQRSLQSYNPLFIRETNIPVFTIVYKTVDRMVHDDLGPKIVQLLDRLNHPDAVPSTAIFELYMALRELTVLREHLTHEDLRILGESRYHEWFNLALDKWFDLAYEKALCRVRAAVESDQVNGVEKHERQSTSAIDTTSCFYQIREFWKQLLWPDPVTGGNFLYKICETVSASTILYADLVFQRIQNSGLLDESKLGPIPEELLIVLNSLEHVRKSVEMLPGDLKLLEETLPSPVRTGSNNNYEPTTRQAAGALLDEAVEQLDARVLRVIGHLAEQMRPEVRRHVFHLAWSPDSLPAESALAPLLDSLDIKLTEFRAGLLDSAFKRALIGIWDILLVELESQGDANTGEKLTSFYERLHKALQLLEDFFHAEGAGVSIEGLHTPTWYRLSSRLDLDRTPTQALINLYYKERMDEQQNATEAAGYGVLTVRAYFHHDSLCVEVLGARDVIPLDPNGLSDPFVIVELLPRTTFSHCVEQRTAVHRRTLNPVFDECFEFSVTAKQCRGDGSAILFTVMDYDVITANDFAGEAFLQLLSIPGISNGGYGADNFHGLRPIELPLMQQANKGHPVLKVLETRVWDKLAQDFVKKQKERFMS